MQNRTDRRESGLVKMGSTFQAFLLVFMPILMNMTMSGASETSLLKEMKAECGKDGITVKLWFKRPFSGVAYSYGHYDNLRCRYISNEDQQQKLQLQPSGTNFSFLIPVGECGTVYHEAPSSPSNSTTSSQKSNFKWQRNSTPENNEIYMENTLLFQSDPTIQEAGDLAQRLRCVWQKEIHKPLVASFPFRNVNLRSEPLRFTGGMQMQSFPGPMAHSDSRLRFQPKGQIQSVPYRRKSSRSLPVTDDGRAPLLKEDIIKSSDAHTIALPLEGDDITNGTKVFTATTCIVLMMPLLGWMVQHFS